MGVVGEAALGAVFGELLRAILSATKKVVMFKETMDTLESTLKSIGPLIKKIEQHNNRLGRPKEELENLITIMEKGTILVGKCSEIHKLDIVNKVRYQIKLEALDNSLTKSFAIDLQAQMARDLKEMLLRGVRRNEKAENGNFPFNISNPNQPSEINIESDYDYANDESDYDDDEQPIKIEGTDSSSIPVEAEASRTSVIGPQHCAPFAILLEIIKTVKTFGSDELSVKDVNGDIIYNLEMPSSFSIHERYTLFDHHKKPIVRLHKKKITAHNRWQVSRGESEEADDLVFNVKERHIIQPIMKKLDVFLAKNTEEKVYDFMVKQSYRSPGSYTVYAAPSNNVIARICKYRPRARFGSSEESVLVRLNPNVDSAFIVALIIAILN